MKWFFFKNKFFLIQIGFSVFLLSMWGCARPTAPTGGPKDLSPPKVIQCVPPNHSANFKGHKFTIYFNEYVQLDKIYQQLMISPPLKHVPDFKLKGKSLIVKLKDTLKRNTTYSVFFGNAIQDLTEGNALKNYTYVFSTGKYVDSLSLRGLVVNAEDLTPEKEVMVMLYPAPNINKAVDTMPTHGKPYYLSRTNDNGYFYFSGLADTTFLLFALQDKNNSLTFDQPNERIAFIDSVVIPQYRPKPIIDSAVLDSSKLLPKYKFDRLEDSLKDIADSIANSHLKLYELYMFRQPPLVLKLIDDKLVARNTIQFVFNKQAENIKIISPQLKDSAINFIEKWNIDKDSLTWFLHEPHPDSLTFFVYEGEKIMDTVRLRAIPKEKILKRKKKKIKPRKLYLSWSSNIMGIIKPGEKLKINFGQPVSNINFDSVLFVSGKDTLLNPPVYFKDSFKMQLVIPFKVVPGTNYQLVIPDSSIANWNGLYNQKISLTFRAKPEKDYGIVVFKVYPKLPGHYIIQMIKNKDKVIEEKYFSKSEEVIFENINPGKYSFRLIFDTNDNGKWDPGNYFLGIEPEKVLEYQKEVTVRANWEIYENWKF